MDLTDYYMINTGGFILRLCYLKWLLLMCDKQIKHKICTNMYYFSSDSFYIFKGTSQ